MSDQPHGKMTVASPATPIPRVLEEKIYRSFFESETIGNVIADAETVRFIRVNRAFCKMTGYSAEELAQLTIWDLARPEDREHDRDWWNTSRQEIDSNFRAEKRYLRKDGSTIWLSVAATIIRNEAGEPSYLVGVAQDVSSRYEALQSLEDERKFLECALFEVTEREQRRIGQELQDHLCQQLLGAAFATKAIGVDVDRIGPEAAARLHNLARLINESVVQARDISRGLHPVELDSEGLMSALQELAHRVSHTIPCEFHCEHDVLVKNSSTALHAYRIAQEALANALQQTGAKRIVITLSQNDDTVCLQIADDGPVEGGLTANAAGTIPKTLQYRARAMQGDISLVFVPGEGTRITNTFPKTS